MRSFQWRTARLAPNVKVNEKVAAAKIETEFGTIRTVEKPKHWREVRKLLDSPKPLLLDTETSGLEINRKLRFVQLGSAKAGDDVWVIDPDKWPWLIDRIWERRAPIVCHNAAFDLVTLMLKDIERAHAWLTQLALNDTIRCTSVARSVAPDRQGYDGNSLSALAAEHGIHNKPEERWVAWAVNVKKWPKADMYWRTPKSEPRYVHYSGHDIFQLRAVWKHYKTMYDDKKYRDMVRTETVVDVAYELMTTIGVYIDLPHAHNLVDEMTVEYEKSMDKLRKHGINSPLAVKTDEYQVGVGDALVNLGAKLTRYDSVTGGALCNGDELDAIVAPEKAAKLAAHVKNARSKSNDMARVRNMIDHSWATEYEELGLLHPNLKRLEARTGRSTCSEPPLQQLNKYTGDKRVRGCISADPGEVIVCVDLDGVEVRMMGELSGDPALCEMLETGADVHGAVALQVWGAHYTELQRHRAKTANFAMLFGATNRSIAAQTGMTVADAARIRKNWNKLYPRAGKRDKSWVSEAERTHRVELACGFAIPIHDRFYAATNYHIQGGAAFLFRRGVARIVEAGLWKYVRMVVHDEVVMSVPDKVKVINRVVGLVRKAMTIEGDHLTFTAGAEVYSRQWNIKP